jgi:hypothetical protein
VLLREATRAHTDVLRAWSSGIHVTILSGTLCPPLSAPPTAGRPTHPRRALRSAQLSTGARKSTFFFLPGNQSPARSTQSPHAVHSTQISACVRASTRAAGRRSALLALYWPVYARVDIASNPTISLLLNRARRGIGRQPLTRTRAHTGRAA